MSQDELRGVLHAAAGAFDVLGELGRDEQNSLLCLAREMTTGELVAVQVDASSIGSATSPSLLVHRVLDPSVRAKVVQGIVRPEQYEPLGAMRRPTGESVTFARERTTGEIITLTPSTSETPRPASSFQTPAFAPPQGFPGAAAAGPAGMRPGARICPSCRNEYGPEVRFCPRDGTILTAAAPQQGLVGEIIAERYRVIRHIGEGGFGQVFLAEHIKMGRPCALKVMNTGLRHDPEAIGRFYREAANTSRIHHPHVAVIYDFGETPDGITYLVMEYVEGDSLGATLKYDGAMPAQRAVHIGAQIADALGAAHALGIVHRDLKPDNILVSQRRDHGDWVKVVDFGIAKATQGDWQNITRTGFVVGTLEYMSPEQITGDPVDGRSDLYSLGCVLFEMLVGEQAFTGPSGQLVLTRRLTEEPPRPRDRNPDVPPALDAVVHRLLARAPDERYADAEEVCAALIESLTAPADLPETGLAAEREAAPGSPASAPALGDAAPAAVTGSTPPSTRRGILMTGGLAAVAVAALVFVFLGGSPSGAETPAEPTGIIDAETITEPEPGTGPAAADPLDAPATEGVQPEPTASPEQPPARAAATPSSPAETGPRSPATETRSTPVEQAPEPTAPAPVTQPAPSTPAAASPGRDPDPVAEAPRPANAAAEIRQVLERYAQALESRDMGQIRTVYPGITSNEQNTWQSFFRSVRDLQVQLGNVQAPAVDGSRAEAPFTLNLEFSDRGGTRQVTQNYRSVLVRSPSGEWRIDSIRAR